MKIDTLRFLTGCTITLLWIVAFTWLLISCASSHEWYPTECCGGGPTGDCRPIPCGEVSYDAKSDIWEWQGHKFFKTRTSEDGLCHVCVHNDLAVCLFVGGTS